ncbi:hypothetical protein SLEP1_g21078 [Rubroshorea leprosula]|uniref:Uncharacterized protein n=1 Tax=Rubroshorea leprosula TaxID=152421 RepID=A0AAV5JC92_9ROSI|nr:hypothetical protein SLEP1_g21078 [Rubroshorea leprosula]
MKNKGSSSTSSGLLPSAFNGFLSLHFPQNFLPFPLSPPNHPPFLHLLLCTSDPLPPPPSSRPLSSPASSIPTLRSAPAPTTSLLTFQIPTKPKHNQSHPWYYPPSRAVSNPFGATLISKEKLDLARQLAKLGVNIIEAGFSLLSSKMTSRR